MINNAATSVCRMHDTSPTAPLKQNRRGTALALAPTSASDFLTEECSAAPWREKENAYESYRVATGDACIGVLNYGLVLRVHQRVRKNLREKR
jgi:hypothetical protein